MKHLLKSTFPRLYNQLVFRWQQIQFAVTNYRFQQKNPHISLPHAYTLYEAYKLHYKKYIEDGSITAGEILADVRNNLPPAPAILDWGCGPARITRHIKDYCADATLIGSDTNALTIKWNHTHFNKIHFVLQNHEPPLPFADQQFDLIIGFSVFTHITATAQQHWLTELFRILKPNGIIWMTTHGNYFIQSLSAAKQQFIREQGIYSTDYPVPGHRLMTTYHDPTLFQQMLEKNFTVMNHWHGSEHPEKAGRQDVWILQKRV